MPCVVSNDFARYFQIRCVCSVSFSCCRTLLSISYRISDPSTPPPQTLHPLTHAPPQTTPAQTPHLSAHARTFVPPAPFHTSPAPIPFPHFLQHLRFPHSPPNPPIIINSFVPTRIFRHHPPLIPLPSTLSFTNCPCGFAFITKYCFAIEF